jgi:hypothetical protein
MNMVIVVNLIRLTGVVNLDQIDSYSTHLYFFIVFVIIQMFYMIFFGFFYTINEGVSLHDFHTHFALLIIIMGVVRCNMNTLHTR